MPRKPGPKSILALLLLAQAWAGVAVASDKSIASPSSLGVFAGMFQLAESTQDVSGPSALSLEYAYQFSRRLGAAVGYSYVLKLNDGFGVLTSGFDTAIHFCIYSCAASEEKIKDTTILQHPTWGLQAGLGLAQRGFQLKSTLLGLSGPLARVDILYRLRRDLGLLLRLQHTSLTNNGRFVTLRSYLLGITFQF